MEFKKPGKKPLMDKNGQLLSDHYLSKGRFKNILRKEILKEKEY